MATFAKNGSHESFPLSLSQYNIWSLESAYPDTTINHISTTVRIQGRIDFVSMQRSILSVLASDVSLRTRVTLSNGVPVQYQVPYEDENFPVFDFSQTDDEGVICWEDMLSKEPMPLFDAPLYRFILYRTGERSGGIFVKLHHIISDGWSQSRLCGLLLEIYRGFQSGQRPDLTESPSYREHVINESDYVNSASYDSDCAFWKNELQNLGEPFALKTIKGALISPIGRRRSYRLPQTLSLNIYSFCNKNRISPFLVFYMALAIYFKRLGGADRFTIGAPINNRRNLAAKKTTGMFVSTLPFSCEIKETWSVLQLSEKVNERWLEVLRHARFPYRDILHLSGGTGSETDRLFHIALSYQDFDVLDKNGTSVSSNCSWFYSGYQAEQLCIHLAAREGGNRLVVEYDFLTQFFSEGEIEALHTCLINILHDALVYPDKPISGLAMLDTAEREKVLYSFNATSQPVFQSNIWEIFEQTLTRFPSRAALVQDNQRISYTSLADSAGLISAAVQRLNAPANSVIAVLLPRNKNLFASMLGIIRAGCAFLLLSSEQPVRRISEIISHSGAAALISTKHDLHKVGLDNTIVPVIDAEQISGEYGLPVQSVPSDLAYIVYTSGSTGTPKGVEITNGGLLNFSMAMASVFGDGGVLSNCSVSFDAFIIESIVALLNGKTIILPLDEQLESPRALAELIKNYSVGSFSITPSRLSTLLSDSEFAKALSRIESIVCGGEAFHSDLLQRLLQLTNARIYNQYGPSEATVGVSIQLLNNATDITAGKPMQNCRLYVLDKWMNPLPVGVYGDLYIGGLCLARGYRNSPDLTAGSFIENPFEIGDRLYRTGDTARWTPTGEIQLAGRTDHQIKLRGLRVELQEISSCLSLHPNVREVTTQILKLSDQDSLVSYYTADCKIQEGELLSFAATLLPRYMIPAFIVQLETMPLTANGKIDTSRLPIPSLPETEIELPANDKQRELLSVFQEVLCNPDIGISHDYFRCGGDSLNAMETIGKVAERMGTVLRVADLYACRNVKRLSELLVDSGKPAKSDNVFELMLPQDRYPLAPIQQGIYVQAMIDPTGSAYNMPGIFKLGFSPDITRLCDAFKQLITGDRIFRTFFSTENDGIFARVSEEVVFDLPVLNNSTLEEAYSEFVRPFDLSCAPLIRAALYKDSMSWYLLLDVHHIISDGISTPLVLKRLDEAYRGNIQSLHQPDFLDYTYFSTQNLAGQQDRLDYWLNNLARLPTPLNLPGDFTRPHSFDYKGASHSFSLSVEDSIRIDKACADAGITPFALFLAAYGFLLSRLAGKDDLIIGVPVAGRTFPETLDMCGPFLSTLPLRLKPRLDITAGNYIQTVCSVVIGMLDHQQITQEELIAALKLPRNLSENPLYQTMFSMNPVDEHSFSLDGNALIRVATPVNTAKADIVIEASRKKDNYAFQLEYATSLYLPETAEFYGRCFTAILINLIDNPDITLEKLDVLSKDDRTRLIDLPNNTVIPFANIPLHYAIEGMANTQPTAPAIIFHGEKMDRQSLEKRACELAALLVNSGARPGDNIGIAVRRGFDIIASMLAVLKMGGAYVPLLSSMPEARLLYMLETAQISFVMCDNDTAVKLPESPDVKLILTESAPPADFFRVSVLDSNLINILFTSGSTGKPKGVMLTHRGAANMQATMQDYLSLANGPILCSTNVVFDAFIGETLSPLAMGKTIVLADEDEMMLPWRLAELIENNGVEIVQFTPARLQMCLSNESFLRALKKVRVILMGGEILTPSLLHSISSATDAITVNMYGPTECTVYMTATRVYDGEHITIGRPIKNGRIYLLDEHMRPVPPTACGELYLSGECLGAGYISRPDLTEAAFIKDPFVPGALMYKTGDIGRLRLDGCYDFMGRRDTQVKLNGQRVELDEITGAIMDTGFALQAATVPIKNNDGSMSLVSFFVPSGDSTASNILSQIRIVLPAYMIPSRLISIENMLYTASSKIDSQALIRIATETAEKSIEIAWASSKPEQMSNNAAGSINADELLAIWRECLNLSDLRADASFFEQGGSSLAALSVLSRYHNRGLVMSLSDFYENPTANGQAALLGIAAPEVHSNTAPVKTETPTVRNTPTLFEHRSSPVESVMLTGATGFLGAHILRSLLSTGSKRIICLSRDGNPDRLRNALEWYFGEEWTQNAMRYTETVAGDICKPLLGMQQTDYSATVSKVGAIWHCAADVRHYSGNPNEIYEANIAGTKEIIALATRAGAHLHHMSTASIAGSRLANSDDHIEFTEENFDIGQDWRENVYVASKFLAEQAVFNAVSQGLPARVYRLGRLVGRSADGVFQKNVETNAFWLILRAICTLGYLPESLAAAPVEMTPIDYCADAILALRTSSISALHPLSPNSHTLEEAVRALSQSVSVVSDDEFDRLFTKASETDSSGVLIPLSDYWNRLKTTPPRISFSCGKTESELIKIGFKFDLSGPERFLSSFRFNEQ